MLKMHSNRERRLLPVVLLAACVSATGCQSTGKQDTGMAIGAGIGAFFGYQLDDGGAAGAVAGAILGGFVGRVIGQYMDENDRRDMAQTLDNNAPGEASSWDNPDTGCHYTTTPPTRSILTGKDNAVI